MKRSYRSAAVLAALLVILPGSALGGAILTFYTLDQTAGDIVGDYGDADLHNAPYEDGGVYLNGLYSGTDPEGSYVKTPAIPDLDFFNMSVRVDFKVSQWPTGARPILFCGASWRWMGASITSSGNLYMNYNGYTGPACAETVSLDEWHTLAMTHDGTTGRLLLDGVEVLSKDFVPQHGDDRRFITHNGSNGSAFHGHVRNLVIYEGVIPFVAGVPEGDAAVRVNELGNHPNPFNPTTVITYDLADRAQVRLAVYDVTGRLVRTLEGAVVREPGPHEVTWRGCDDSGNQVAAGVYVALLEAGGTARTTRLTLVR